jgi:hypothetical protein
VTSPAPTAAHGLRDLPRGTGRVLSVIVRAEETLLSLGYPGGRRVLVAVPNASSPDGGDERSLRALRPLAVRLANKQAAFACSVLGTTRTGPRRVEISLTQALRLCAGGVHTVLCTD